MQEPVFILEGKPTKLLLKARQIDFIPKPGKLAKRSIAATTGTTKRRWAVYLRLKHLIIDIQVFCLVFEKKTLDGIGLVFDRLRIFPITPTYRSKENIR